ncbi:hypothetical protein ACP70R_039323 [Stipagrostis hirtigluma subsp. patula]
MVELLKRRLPASSRRPPARRQRGHWVLEEARLDHTRLRAELGFANRRAAQAS